MTYHHFEILQRENGEPWVLGQGAGGITYKARDTQLARLVALKVVTADAFRTPEAKERFVAEARTAASLHHPNIASIHYFGEQNGDCFYAMEFVDGCTLEELVQREGALSSDVALDIASQTAAALGVAHEADLIHRDIKPANILITESSSGARRVKLIDFGLAAGANATASGKAVFAGTPLFASPEQLDEADVDARSDVYSLGAVLFFMICGRPPYVGTLSQIVTQHTLQPTPVDLISSAPAEVIALVKRYMKKDPNQRPRSGAQARAEAEAALRALRPDNQATAAEWLTSHYEAVSRQRQVEGGFLYRLTKAGEQDDALHLDRSAAGLQAADQYRFAVPKIAGLGCSSLREPGTLVEVADGLLVITKSPALSTRLLSVMRVRRMLPLDEARLILEPLANALDEAALEGLPIPHLGLRDIELFPAQEPQTRLTVWPELRSRVDLLPIAEATSINTSATIVGSSLVTAGRVASGDGADPSAVVASLAYELLGGMTAPSSGRYVPIAELSEAQNKALSLALSVTSSSAFSASKLIADLFDYRRFPLTAASSPVPLRNAANKQASSLARGNRTAVPDAADWQVSQPAPAKPQRNDPELLGKLDEGVPASVSPEDTDPHPAKEEPARSRLSDAVFLVVLATVLLLVTVSLFVALENPRQLQRIKPELLRQRSQVPSASAAADTAEDAGVAVARAIRSIGSGAQTQFPTRKATEAPAPVARSAETGRAAKPSTPRYIAVDVPGAKPGSKAVMIYDIESRRVVGDNVYNLKSAPAAGSTKRFDSKEAQYIGR